jgi:hypothetical protein
MKGTADPSTTLRSGRDDKGECGALREGWLVAEGNSRSLHYATPDFLLTLVASVHSMRPSLRKGAHASLSSAAWQEIRVRSGRDDTSVCCLKFVSRSLRPFNTLAEQTTVFGAYSHSMVPGGLDVMS